MSEIKFVPKMCQGDDARYKGELTISSMGFDERLDAYEEIGLDNMDKESLQKNWVKLLRVLGKRSHSFVKCCDIVRVSDGHKYADWNEVFLDGDLFSLVSEVCGLIVGKASSVT